MSEARQNIKDTFNSIKDLSGQRGQARTLDNKVDELIDSLNDFTEATSDKAEKEQAQQSVKGLINAKDEDIAKVKVLEDEARGKGATINKERAYSRQLDTAIDSIKSQISYFL